MKLANIKKAFPTLIIFILLLTLNKIAISNTYTQKDVDASFNYYRRFSDAQKLSPNDRLAILNRIIEKYSSSKDLDLSKVKSEINKQQSLKNKTPTNTPDKSHIPQHPPTTPKMQPIDTTARQKDNPKFRLWDAILDETDNEYILNLISDKPPEGKNIFLLKDPDPTVPPKIVLDLYGVFENIKDPSHKEFKFPTESSATIESIKIAQFESEPNPVVRTVVFLKKDARYTTKDTNSGITLIITKDDKDKGRKIFSSLQQPISTTVSSTTIIKTIPAVSPPTTTTSTDNVITPAQSNLPLTPLETTQQKSTYKIEPGDVLGINIYPAEDLSRDAAVGPEGDITLPLIGVVRAAGNTTSRLADSLTRAYSKYIANPEVSVTVKQYARRTVFVTGELKSTGGFPYKDGLRLLELISQAGGFTDKSDRKKIKIIRGDGRTRKTFIVDAEEIVKSGDLTKDFVLEAGDIVEVPEGLKRKISILGDVRTPGYYDYKDGLKLIEAVSMAGGFTETARINKVSILRKAPGVTQTESQTLTINLDEILKGARQDIEILPDDTIYVPKKTISTASWWVSNVLPWLSLISLILVIRGGL